MPNCALIIWVFCILIIKGILPCHKFGSWHFKGLAGSFGLLWKIVCSLQQRSLSDVSWSSLAPSATSLSKGLMSMCKTEPSQVRGFLESANKFCPFDGGALSWCNLTPETCFCTTTCLVSLQVRCSGGSCGRFPSICLPCSGTVGLCW